ncbi:hypothetical protein V6N13_126891 [Hibiscus sabdariffa]
MRSRFVIFQAEPKLEMVHECHNDYDVGQQLELANASDSALRSREIEFVVHANVENPGCATTNCEQGRAEQDTSESIRSIEDEQMELDEDVVMVGDAEVRNTTMNLAWEVASSDVVVVSGT